TGKREANARNAQLSTGPRTDAGKARSRRNALKHGLAIPIAAHPHLSTEARKLAQELVVHGVTGDPVSLAEACLDLCRIREIRADVVATILVPAQSTRGRDELTSTIATLTQLDRYEQRARALCDGAYVVLSQVVCMDELNEKWKVRRTNPPDLEDV
ncbi:MAG: hypothetical protein ACJ8CQ_17870, partial [Microvirga sp.]